MVMLRLFKSRMPGSWNPIYNLGALSFYLFWLVIVTGIYLFIFFETSISGAYQSVADITDNQFYIGSVMRSLHRYATMAMAITITLHLLKELQLKKYADARRFSWISGVPLLWLFFASRLAAIGWSGTTGPNISR